MPVAEVNYIFFTSALFVIRRYIQPIGWAMDFEVRLPPLFFLHNSPEKIYCNGLNIPHLKDDWYMD